MARRNSGPRRGRYHWGWRDGRYVRLGVQGRYLPAPPAPRFYPGTLQAAAAALPALRRAVRSQAAAAARESFAVLDGADAIRVNLPASGSGSSLRDFLAGCDPREIARLRSRWYSTSPADSVDNVAGRLRAAVPGCEQLSDDAVMSDIWLHHTRVIDAAKYIGRGHKSISLAARRIGRLRWSDLAPGIESDGYDVAVIMGPDDEACEHVAAVDAVRESDDAYRMLAGAAVPRLGPAAWLLTVESFETEVCALLAQLAGDDPLEMSEHDTRERLGELVPKTLDDGAGLATIHARIVECANRAGMVHK